MRSLSVPLEGARVPIVVRVPQFKNHSFKLFYIILTISIIRSLNILIPTCLNIN